jgi:hypothetical protein
MLFEVTLVGGCFLIASEKTVGGALRPDVPKCNIGFQPVEKTGKMPVLLFGA